MLTRPMRCDRRHRRAGEARVRRGKVNILIAGTVVFIGDVDCAGGFVARRDDWIGLIVIRIGGNGPCGGPVRAIRRDTSLYVQNRDGFFQ